MKQRADSGKINKIDKPLSKVIKRQRENIQINKIRNGKRDITTNTEEIQRIIRSYYTKNLYSRTLKNVKEMGDFLDRYNVPKLNQVQVKSSPQKPPKQKKPRTNSFS